MSTSDNSMSADPSALLSRSITLMKPVTWFGPMWAFLCGAVASGATGFNLEDIGMVLLGIIMSGPLLCGVSQVINDYFDREVDAINQPERLIPSGKVSLRQVMVTIIVLITLGTGIALFLGQGVLILVTIGLILGILYSAPPVRAKRNGWVGNSVVAISYEGLAWMAGHVAFAPLTWPSVFIALMYSLGTHGIMSINDYKSLDGDRISGIQTIPLQLGPERAARLIVLTMNFAQLVVIGAFLLWQQWIVAAVLVAILIAQVPTQRNFLKDPTEQFLKFSAIGVSFFVWGMLVAAIGLRLL